MAQKRTGPEKGNLAEADLQLHRREYERLFGMLEDARGQSQLPENPAGRVDLHEFLIEIRTNS
ncbi:MAG: hypothetical protein V3W41_05850 [Planctomycetota bacterium]